MLVKRLSKKASVWQDGRGVNRKRERGGGGGVERRMSMNQVCIYQLDRYVSERSKNVKQPNEESQAKVSRQWDRTGIQ